jgi:hypothetical protein
MSSPGERVGDTACRLAAAVVSTAVMRHQYWIQHKYYSCPLLFASQKLFSYLCHCGIFSHTCLQISYAYRLKYTDSLYLNLIYLLIYFSLSRLSPLYYLCPHASVSLLGTTCLMPLIRCESIFRSLLVIKFWSVGLNTVALLVRWVGSSFFLHVCGYTLEVLMEFRNWYIWIWNVNYCSGIFPGHPYASVLYRLKFFYLHRPTFSVKKTELTAGGGESVALTTQHPLSPQKLALTSPTSGGRSVGIIRLRTKGHGV